MDTFQSREKREQDAILFLAAEDGNTLSKRRDYFFLNKPIRRACFECILGVSSHRVDRLGHIDRRFRDSKDPSKPSPLSASVDSFCMVLYNSLAEPLPTKFLVVHIVRLVSPNLQYTIFGVAVYVWLNHSFQSQNYTDLVLTAKASSTRAC